MSKRVARPFEPITRQLANNALASRCGTRGRSRECERGPMRVMGRNDAVLMLGLTVALFVIFGAGRESAGLRS